MNIILSDVENRKLLERYHVIMKDTFMFKRSTASKKPTVVRVLHRMNSFVTLVVNI